MRSIYVLLRILLLWVRVYIAPIKIENRVIMKKITTFILLLIGVTSIVHAQTRRYLVDNTNQKFATLGTIGSDMYFIADTPIASGENAGAIDPNNLSIGYVLSDAGDFYEIDVETGTYTLLGNMLSDWQGMEFDEATGILYAITTTDLYSIDPVAVTATLVGSLGFTEGEQHPIALGIDNGVGYIIESYEENSYTVDLNTGTATLLGSLYNPDFPEQDRIGDVGGMHGLTVVYTQNAHYRYSLYSSLNTTTGQIGSGAYIDTPYTYNQEHGWFSYGQEFSDTSSCPIPVFIDGTTYSGTEIELFWMNFSEDDAVNGYDWELYYKDEDPDTATPLQSGHTPQYETFVTISGLESGFFYDFYLVRDCGANGTSQRTTRTRIQTLLEWPQCGIQNYYDAGGGNETYYSNQYSGSDWTIAPENEGEGVEVSFLEFDLQDGHDVLYIHDGPNRWFPLFDSGQPATSTGFPAGGYTGTTLPGTFKATHKSGKLTFVLYSDDDYTDNAGWNATVECFQLRPPNDLIENAYDIDELDGFPYRDENQLLQYATEEVINPVGCSIFNKTGVWYKFTAEESGTIYAEVVTPLGDTYIAFYSAPDENATEEDLTFVEQDTNYCDQSALSSITVEAGETYYVYAVNTVGETDVYMTSSLLDLINNDIKGFSYHPNPTTGILSLNAIDAIDSVVIYNLLGQRIVTKNVKAVTAQLDLSHTLFPYTTLFRSPI